MSLASDKPESSFSYLPESECADSTNSTNSRLKSSVSKCQNTENSGNALLNRLPYKISTDAFYANTTEQERDLIRFEVNCALQHFIEFDRPVFLEGLGLIIPSKSERVRAYPSDQSLIIRKELIRSVVFEKCDDISGAQSIYESDGKKIVETYELANRIYPRLPLGMHIKWSTQAMRSLLRAYLMSVRERLVTKGVSQILSAVGTLYALHNRQGHYPSDWFAGADILLTPRRSQVLQVLESRLCARPVFNSAWEPLEALYGPPVRTFCLDLLKVLNETGLALDESANQDHQASERCKYEVAVFLDRESKPLQPRLIWCTEGIRKLAIKNSKGAVASELVVQTPAKASDARGSVDRHFLLACRLLALGWATLESTRNKTLRPGLGINAETSLVSAPKTVLSAAVATHLNKLAGVHQDQDGEFSYANITGISSREAKLISGGKRIHLLAMLELRGYDQLTQPGRGCLMEHTRLD